MFAILVKYDQGSVEVSCSWRGACARKGGWGCWECKAANKNWNVNHQCRWRSCNEVIKRLAAGYGLKIIKLPAVRYFPYFSSKSKKYLYENVLPLFTILKCFQAALNLNLIFLANSVYRVRSHPSAWHLETFQWHGWTRSSNNSIFLFEICQFSLGKYSTFINNPQARLESEKIQTLSVSPTLYTEYEEIQAWHYKISSGHYRKRSSNN